MKNISIKNLSLVVALVVGIITTTSAAEVKARIVTKDGKPVTCMLMWKASTQVYVAREGKATREYSTDDIQAMRVEPPANWSEILKKANSASPESAVPQLERIINDYAMLEFDEKAGSVAAQIYLKQGKPNDALKICEKVIQKNKRAAYASEMSSFYWQAMIQSGKTASLPKLLDRAMGSGNNSVIAAALIARGDLLSSENKYMEALKDGYLRVVFLYGSDKTKHPEAIFKAYEAFTKLGQTTNAEKMRNMILKNSQYKQTEWGKKLTSGR